MYAEASRHAVTTVTEQLWITAQQVLAYLLWAVMASLAAGAGCWCCGYVAREAWLRMRPERPSWPRHRSAPTEEERAVTREAAQGVQEIERYLASVAAQRPLRLRNERPDGDAASGAPSP